jgi:DNA-binding Lrp family transcriptional regulator
MGAATNQRGGTVKAYILIHTRVGRGPAVTKEVSAIKGVISVDEVTGPYDVIVHGEARSLDELSRQVVAKIQQVEGVERTLTCSVVHL